MPHLVVGLLISSFSAVLVFMAAVGSVEMSLYRVIGGGWLLIAYGLFQIKGHHFKAFFTRRYFLLCVLASFFLCIDLIGWHAGILLIGPGLSTLIINLHVVVFAILSCLSGRTPFRWSLVVSILLCFLGFYFLLGINNVLIAPINPKGVWLSFMSLIGYTFFISVMRLSRIHFSNIPTAINLGVVNLISGVMLSSYVIVGAGTIDSSMPQNLAVVCAYVILIPFSAWLLITYGLPSVPLVYVGLLFLIQPVGAYIWEILFLHRDILPMEVIGFFITIFGVFFGIKNAYGSK